MPIARTDPRQNHLLAAIPDMEWDRFGKFLTPVALSLGEVIYESGADQPFVFFPTNSIVSLLYVMEDGAAAEIAIVGNEGLVGISLFMGGDSTPNRAIVQSAGFGFRMKGKFVRDEFLRAGPIQQLFLRYTQALLTQMGQTAVCNRHHTVNQRPKHKTEAEEETVQRCASREQIAPLKTWVRAPPDRRLRCRDVKLHAVIDTRAFRRDATKCAAKPPARLSAASGTRELDG
jgi:hypothetical protein